MEFAWTTSPDTRDATVAALHESGGKVKERMGFEPLTTIVVVASMAVIVRSVSKLLKDHRFRGVLVDVTRTPVEVREMPGWDRGQVLLIDQNGPTFHEFQNDDGLQALLSLVGGKG